MLGIHRWCYHRNRSPIFSPSHMVGHWFHTTRQHYRLRVTAGPHDRIRDRETIASLERNVNKHSWNVLITQGRDIPPAPEGSSDTAPRISHFWTGIPTLLFGCGDRGQLTSRPLTIDHSLSRLFRGHAYGFLRSVTVLHELSIINLAESPGVFPVKVCLSVWLGETMKHAQWSGSIKMRHGFRTEWAVIGEIWPKRQSGITSLPSRHVTGHLKVSRLRVNWIVCNILRGTFQNGDFCPRKAALLLTRYPINQIFEVTWLFICLHQRLHKHWVWRKPDFYPQVRYRCYGLVLLYVKVENIIIDQHKK